MTQHEATEIALAYVAAKHVKHYGYRDVICLNNFQIKSSYEADPNFPNSVRSKVWRIVFFLYNPDPNVIVSGGEYVVFVDDETGACGSMVTL